jgi:hypothetical protein
MSSTRASLLLTGLGLAMASAAVALVVGATDFAPWSANEVLAVERDPTAGDGEREATPDPERPTAPGSLAASLDVAWRELGTLSAPAGERITWSVTDGGRFVEDPDLRVVAGPALVDPALGGRHLVEVTSGLGGLDGGRFYRFVRLAPAAVDEHEPRGTIELGARRHITGFVVDAEGAPVEGARVWHGSAHLDGTPVLATTDPEGRYEFDAVAEGSGVPLIVVAEGYASAQQVFDVRGVAEPTRVRLEPAAAALDVRLVLGADPSASSVLDAVRGRASALLVPGGGVIPTALRAYPFCVAALPTLHEQLFGGGSGAGRIAFDERGQGRIADAPAGVDLLVVPSVAGFGGEGVPVRTRADRVENVTLQATSAPLPFAVRVVDEQGEPIADAVARRRVPRGSVRAPAFALAAAAHSGIVAESDADGLLFLPLEGEGPHVVEIRARNPERAIVHVSIERGDVAGGAPRELPLPRWPALDGAGERANRLELVWENDRALVGVREARSSGGSGLRRLWATDRPFVLDSFDHAALVELEVRGGGDRIDVSRTVAVCGPTAVALGPAGSLAPPEPR